MEEFEVNNMSKECNIPWASYLGKCYLTKLHTFVNVMKRHDVFTEPEVQHATDGNRGETSGVDLF